jgi:hypothetical protein
MAKRGQGLPLNLIVLAIIAALVLVLIIAFTVGGAGSSFSRIFKVGATAAGDEIESVRAACRQSCSTAESTVGNLDEWKTSGYCKKKSSIDLDGSGKLDDSTDPAKDEVGIRCWSKPISIQCSFSVSTAGGVKTINRPVDVTSAVADCLDADLT